MNLKFSQIVLTIIFVSLFFLPRAVEGPLYFACCDDTRLYYIFPQKYLDNYAKNLVLDNTWAGANTGYYPGSQMIPILYLINALKLIPYNTQYLMYGINLSFAFLFTYMFLSLWIKKHFWTKTVSSLFYVLSPFLIKTIYLNQLMSIHLVWVLPATLYLIVRSIYEKNVLLTFTAALIFSIFTAGINTMPFFVPIFVTSLPLFIYLFLKFTKRTVIYTFLFGFIYIFLNAHWLFHFYNSIFNTVGLGGIVGNFSSSEFINENIRGILGASTLFSPLNQPLNTLDLNLTKNISWLNISNLLFTLIIVSGGIFASMKPAKKNIHLFLIIFMCLLLAWFLVSPNFDKWGPNIFLIFATKIPGFTMFRNMFDKFAPSMGFYFAITMCFSLVMIFSRIKSNTIRSFILIAITLLTIYNAKSRFKPYNVHEGIQAKISGEFNDDFNSLVDHLLKEQNPSRVLWLPLNYPTYVSVEDKYNANHFYSGLSPLRYLANRQDYSGQFSFIIPGNTYLGDKVAKMIRSGEYEAVGKVFQAQNARFVIIDKQTLPDRMQSFLYGADKAYLKMQTPEFIQSLLGTKIADYGNRYTLYSINPKFISDRIYLTNDINNTPAASENMKYTKLDSNTFEITINNLTTNTNLVLLDPFYKEWTLYLLSNKQKMAYKKGENFVVNNYANGWELDPKNITEKINNNFYTTNPDKSINLKFQLHFTPSDFDKYLYPINIMSYGLVGITQIILILKLRQKYV